ncbi:hypothetical protein BJ138DRAFT_1118428 [Hygrophoropsis aurantiaca]|uniref:Uncharacterized protein n=1 Tax=Hygrophoropsis aurantiaca TaxID=72124 RepID=A0ACB7ZWS8_9AGAM|nr:hypothetical protein BJ138DRAFT_1118428 [Hygrophoropsis aurantiaca]
MAVISRVSNRVTFALVLTDVTQESFVRIQDQENALTLHFVDGTKFYSFLKHLTDRVCDPEGGIHLSLPTLTQDWLTFNIPGEWPAAPVFHRRFGNYRPIPPPQAFSITVAGPPMHVPVPHPVHNVPTAAFVTSPISGRYPISAAQRGALNNRIHYYPLAGSAVAQPPQFVSTASSSETGPKRPKNVRNKTKAKRVDDDRTTNSVAVRPAPDDDDDLYGPVITLPRIPPIISTTPPPLVITRSASSAGRGVQDHCMIVDNSELPASVNPCIQTVPFLSTPQFQAPVTASGYMATYSGAFHARITPPDVAAVPAGLRSSDVQSDDTASGSASQHIDLTSDDQADQVSNTASGAKRRRCVAEAAGEDEISGKRPRVGDVL